MEPPEIECCVKSDINSFHFRRRTGIHDNISIAVGVIM